MSHPAKTQQAASLTDSRYKEHVAFWKERLALVDGDFCFRQNWHSYALAGREVVEITVEVDSDAQRFIGEMSGGQDIAAFVILLSAVYRALHLYTNANVISVDAPQLQSDSGNDSLIPLIAHVLTNQTVELFLNQVRQTVADSYTYQGISISAVAEIILKRQSSFKTNVFVSCAGIHKFRPYNPAYDLAIEIQTGSKPGYVLYCKPESFSQSFLQGFARHLANIVSEFTNLQKSLVEVSGIDVFERERLLQAFNNAREEFPIDKSVADLFSTRAIETPNAIAIKTADRELTYSELNDVANNLAGFLRNHFGIGSGDVVGLFFERSELSIIGLLGILKAGGVYLPLDIEYPIDRLKFIASDANAKAFMIHSDHLSKLMEFSDVPMFALDLQLSALESIAADITSHSSGDHPAYIIYTSGSTGRPKGVVLEHSGLINTILHHIDAFEVGPTDRLSQFYSASFDSSLFEMFVALLSGATLVIVKKETISDPQAFADYIKSAGVTMLTVPPIYLNTLDSDKLSLVKKIVSAGDNALLGTALNLARDKAYYNSYGPTETSICVTHYRVDPNTSYDSRIPIGKPISNTSIYLLDDQMNLVPEGCIGEICVSGIALARGYLNRDDLTEQSFVANPFAQGERIYKTGDLGVWLPDGNLELIGRKDSQVKIRGYRVELGEIESWLGQNKAIKEAVVLAREDTPGDKRLVAYFTAIQPVSASDLRDYLRNHLPEFMIPSAFVLLSEMPVTENGKIDRKTLPAPHSVEDTTEREAPRNDKESILAEIWSELLATRQIGIHDNFFELGGDSILIIQMVSRAARAGLKLNPQQVFEHQTIAALATVAEIGSVVQAEQDLIVGPVGMLPMQRWFFKEDIKERHHFNQSVMLDVPGDIQTDILAECVAGLLTHHDALRSHYIYKDGEWLQEIGEETGATPFAVSDLSSLSVENGRAEMEREAARLQSTLDLTNGPLIRVHLFRLNSTEARLLFIAHHLVVDGISWRILLEDLYSAYRQKLSGEQIQVAPKTTSVREWVAHLIDNAAIFYDEREYWLEQENITGGIPVDFNRGGNSMESAEELTVTLDESVTQALLQKASAAYNTQINDILLTALALLFKEWSGQSDLLVDLESHGREDLFPDVDLSRTVGWLTAVYPSRLTVEQTGPGDILKSIKEQLRRIPNHGIGYGILRHLSESAHHTSASSKQAEIVFNYLGQTTRALSVDGDWRPVPGNNGGERTKLGRRSHLLEITGLVIDGRLSFTWEYSRNLHGPETIRRQAERYLEIVRSLVDHCCSINAKNFTPSDFPGARIDQTTLDALIARIALE